MNDLDTGATLRCMTAGLVFAVLACLPVWSWIYGEGWGWAERFPLSWLGAGLNAMSVFFHEIGHTLFFWFYGYPALPMFDFQHGGGYSWTPTMRQQGAIIFCLYAAVGYALWTFRQSRALQVILGMVLLFNLTTAFGSYHMAIVMFMGPGFEIAVASFLLFRAWLDLAPRGGFERFVNAMFGFAMIFRALIDGWALLHDGGHRFLYYNQKGQHGFGDFDRVADALPALGFNGAVGLWMLTGVAGLVIPLFLYLFLRPGR